MKTRKQGGVRGGPTASTRSKRTKGAKGSKRSKVLPLMIQKPTISRRQVSKALGIYEDMGITGASVKNVRSILEGTSDRNLSESARNLKRRYHFIVDDSIRQLQHASKLEVITEKHKKAYGENTRHRRTAALLQFSVRSPQKAITAIMQTYYKRIDPEFASYFLNYVHDTFVRNKNFQPILVPSHYADPPVYVDPDVEFKIKSINDEKEIDEYTLLQKNNILSYLANQGREPSFFEFPDAENANNVFKHDYLACGTMYVNALGYASPLEGIVQDDYPAAALHELPLYFVFQTPKTLMKAHDSHVSILVLYNATWYSIGLGFTGELSPKVKRAGLYNPDHVIGIGGVDSSNIPHHLRLIDMGIFRKKHLDRIMDLVKPGKFQNPVELEFGNPDEEDCEYGGLSSQIIPLNMPYKYITCAKNDPSTLNCTSFAQYVFRERIECRPIEMLGVVHPSNCKRKQNFLTMEKLQAFIEEYKAGNITSPQLVEDLSWEA